MYLFYRQWANFRKSYAAIGSLRRLFPEVPFIALTATATQETQQKVLQSLEMTAPKIFAESVSRTNLKLKVIKKENDVIEQIHSIIEKDYQGQTGIIYMQTTDECKKITAELQMKGIKIKSYFGAMKSDTKVANQKMWMDGRIQLMSATSAFGAGVDKKDVRIILHGSLPNSIEDYVQQVGRAGRDGENASAILLYSAKDVESGIDIVSPPTTRSPDKFQVEGIQRILELQDFLTSKGECRNAVLRQYFGEQVKTCIALGGEACDNCDEKVDNTNVDIMVEASAITEELQRRESFEFNVLVDSLKGTTRPDDSCKLVAIMRFWPTPEIQRFVRFIARNGLVTLEPDYHPETEEVIVNVKLGPKWNFDKSQFMLFPLSNSVKNDIEQSKFQEPEDNAELQLAGRMFVSPPPIRSSKRATNSTRLQF